MVLWGLGCGKNPSVSPAAFPASAPHPPGLTRSGLSMIMALRIMWLEDGATSRAWPSAPVILTLALGT